MGKDKTWPSNSAPLGTKAIFDLRRWLAWLYIKWWIHLYADDTIAFVIGKNEDEVVTLLNIVFSEISKWCNTNNLTIHPTKCKVIIISRKSFTGPLKPVKWGNKCLEYTDKVKVLGVYTDNKLTWKPHIKELTKSFNAQLKSLKRISYVSTKELERIYYKLIIPHINYCISVWGNCPISAFEPIEALHVKAPRLIQTPFFFRRSWCNKEGTLAEHKQHL